MSEFNSKDTPEKLVGTYGYSPSDMKREILYVIEQFEFEVDSLREQNEAFREGLERIAGTCFHPEEIARDLLSKYPKVIK